MVKPKYNNNNLDEKDLALLEILQADCTTTDVQISQMLRSQGITLGPAACGNRIKYLNKEGYIKSNRSILDASRFDLRQTCFMFVTLHIHDVETTENFLSVAKSDTSVLEIHEMLGICDYLLKVRVADMAEATKLSQRLAGKIVAIQTHAAGETIKEETAIHIPGR